IFFFQAEDGIRDRNVTGVQTCALPISVCSGTGDVVSCETENRRKPSIATRLVPSPHRDPGMDAAAIRAFTTGPSVERLTFGKHRSEERRVGKECRSRRRTDHDKKKKEK